MRSTPQMHSGMVTTVAEEILSLRIIGDSRATIRGARNVNVLASAIGRRVHAVKKQVMEPYPRVPLSSNKPFLFPQGLSPAVHTYLTVVAEAV